MSQSTPLRGRLVDEKSNPVGFANVSLLRTADSSLARTVISDSSGRFSLAISTAGRYRLQITAIGFFEWKSPSSAVTGAEDEKLLQTD